MEMTIEQVLERGIAAHKAGKHQDAEKLCNANFVIIDKSRKTLTCLNYPQTKALLSLQGYVSRSSKHKKK